MTNKLLTRFLISDENLRGNPLIQTVYDNFSDLRDELRKLRKVLSEADKELRDLLDPLLRAQKLIPEGCDWTLTLPELEDEEDGLIIQVWSEPKQRGRRKSELPIKQLSVGPQVKGPKAA